MYLDLLTTLTMTSNMNPLIMAMDLALLTPLMLAVDLALLTPQIMAFDLPLLWI